MDLIALKKPFPASDIEWRVGATNKDKTKGIALAYITNRAIMERLDNVCGESNWKNEFRLWKENSQLCGISIRVNDEWITKWDGADNSKMEGTKGGLSDAMKRAGYQWGIGRYLYHLPVVWVKIEPRGSSYVLAETPGLPEWARPTGSGRPDPATDVSTIVQAVDESEQQGTPSECSGTVEKVSRKTGTTNNKEWTRYGVLINGTWYNTLNKEIGLAANNLKGKSVEFSATKNQYGYELVTIQEVVDVNKQDDGLPF